MNIDHFRFHWTLTGDVVAMSEAYITRWRLSEGDTRTFKIVSTNMRDSIYWVPVGIAVSKWIRDHWNERPVK